MSLTIRYSSNDEYRYNKTPRFIVERFVSLSVIALPLLAAYYAAQFFIAPEHALRAALLMFITVYLFAGIVILWKYRRITYILTPQEISTPFGRNTDSLTHIPLSSIISSHITSSFTDALIGTAVIEIQTDLIEALTESSQPHSKQLQAALQTEHPSLIYIRGFTKEDCIKIHEALHRLLTSQVT